MKIAAVSYLNTAPLIQGLEAWNDCHLIRAVPSQIAAMVQSDQADIGLASIIDYAKSQSSQSPLVLIPAGMIGCDGPTLTVKLLSQVPINQITTVHADTDSHTSIALCDLILQKQHDIKAAFIDHNIQSGTATPPPNPPETLLIIGDKVVTSSPSKDLYPHQIDLGQAWNDLTNLPFVYATWMCKQSRIFDPESKASIIAAAHILERTMLKNQTRIDWIIANHAPTAGWPIDLAQKYLGELLRFKVDDRAKQAVQTFLTMTAELGITPQVHPNWLDLSSSPQQTPSPALV